MHLSVLLQVPKISHSKECPTHLRRPRSIRWYKHAVKEIGSWVHWLRSDWRSYLDGESLASIDVSGLDRHEPERDAALPCLQWSELILETHSDKQCGEQPSYHAWKPELHHQHAYRQHEFRSSSPWWRPRPQPRYRRPRPKRRRFGVESTLD